MAAFSSLITDGWHVDEFRLRGVLAENYDETASTTMWAQVLSNLDIRDFGAAVVADRTDNSNTLRGPIVVQLSKWENVSFPKINEHTKNDGVCSLILTDGHKSTKAMATEPLTRISGDTPYGSKILLYGNLRFENGILQLNNANTKFIGGTVDKLVEKWRSEKYSTSKADRGSGDAPKWVPFGKRGGALAPQNDGFKAMPSVGADAKTGESNVEFEAARQTEIAALKEVKKSAPSYLKQPETAPKKDIIPKNSYQHVSQPSVPVAPSAAPITPQTGGRGGRRRRDDEVDIRTYISRPTGGGTIFDLIKGRLGDDVVDSSPAPPAPLSTEPHRGYNRHNDFNNRRGGGSKPQSRGYQQGNDTPRRQFNASYRRRNDLHAVTEGLSDMSIAPPAPREFNPRGRGNRNTRGGSRSFTNSVYRNNGPSNSAPIYQNPPTAPLPPPPGIEVGRAVVAPYVDGNVSRSVNSSRGNSRGRARGSGANSNPSRGSTRGRGRGARGSNPS